MSYSCGTRGCCHHRTSGTQSSDQDGQQASCTSCGARFNRGSQYPLRRRADALARVDAGRIVLRLDRALSTDLGPSCACPVHDASSLRRNHAQCGSRRTLGRVSNCRCAVRPQRRESRIGSSRRPFRSFASNLCRNGGRLGRVPRPPRTANNSVRERDRPSRCGWNRRAGVHLRSGFGSPARPPCAGRRG